MKIVANNSRVEAFVKDALVLTPAHDAKSIGVLSDDGEVIAGVVYEQFNDFNCFMHVAAVPGRFWLSRLSLFNFFNYPFNTCGLRRVTGWVDETNVAARRLDEHLGFRLEARLVGAANSGGDALIYAMTREECRFLGGRNGKQEQRQKQL